MDYKKYYQRSISTGGSREAIKALIGLSNLYLSYVKSLNSIQFDQGMAEKDIEALKEQISELSFPIEDQSVETVNEAFKLAKKISIRDGSIGKIFDLFNKVNLTEKPKMEVEVLFPKISTPKVLSRATASAAIGGRDE